MTASNATPGAGPSPRVLVIAGEVSGDLHAAALIREVHKRRPEVHVSGIGGDAMREEGVELLYHVKEMAVMGIGEVLARYLFFRRVFFHMLTVATEQRPDAVLLVDYPGFNLRFAGRTHRLGLKNLYYICPKVWAWKSSRIPTIARDVDRLLTILPFESDCFKEYDLNVDFVGHPLVDAARASLTQEAELPWRGGTRVALLPGSRGHEIRRILPRMWEAAALLETEMANIGFIVACPNGQAERLVRDIVEGRRNGPANWAIVTGQTHQVLRQARATLVASGTATLDAALMRCPMVITYRVGLTSYCVARLFVKIPYVGLVNIVAGREVCPELLQYDATAEALARAVRPLLGDTPERERMLRNLDGVIASLGEGGAAQRAAAIVLEELACGHRSRTSLGRSG